MHKEILASVKDLLDTGISIPTNLLFKGPEKIPVDPRDTQYIIEILINNNPMLQIVHSIVLAVHAV